MESTNLDKETISSILKETFDTLERNGRDNSIRKVDIFVSQHEYDMLSPSRGSSLGYDLTKVNLIIGYPKFDL